MSDEEGLTETLRALREWAERRSGCRLLVLFGSAADGRDETVGRGEAAAVSGSPGDLDLAVAFEALPGPRRRLRIIGELQDMCAPRAVDVVFLHRDTDPVLRFEVFRRGVPIHQARAGLFIDEVVRALALYEDALPFRRALRRSLASTGEGA